MGGLAHDQRCGLTVVGAGIVYFALASLMWQIDPTWGSAFWPAAGVTFALLVRCPTRWWPAILAAVAVAELSVNILNDTTLTTAVWGAVANSVEPAVGAGLFVHVTRARRINGLPDLLWFVLLGAVTGPAIGALFGGLLAVGGPSDALTRWLRWFVGDGVGVLAVAPLLLMPAGRVRSHHRAEVAGLGLALAGVGVVLFAATGTLELASPYLAVPVLVWAAIRFGLLGAAVGSTVVATVVHAATATGHGAFAIVGGDGLVVAQTYIGAMALSVLTVAVLVEDVAVGRRHQALLLHRALHDPLTGLPNRAMLDQRLAEGGVGAVLLADLDGFKAVNDELGHGTGDEVLRALAARLLAVSRPEDLVARVGGDEFVVVLGGIVDEADLDATAQRLHHQLCEPVVLPDCVVSVGASVGAVAATLHERAEDLLLEADRRMYRGKRARRRGDASPSV